MKYIAKATHLLHIIRNLKPDALFKTDANDIRLECDTETMAKDVEWANECVEKALKEQGLIKE